MMTFEKFKERYPEWSGQRVRLVVADDSLLGREGMRKLMTQPPMLKVAAIASTAEALYPLCEQHHPTVVILDLCLPLPADGLAACRKLHERFPDLPVLVVTGHEQELAVKEVKAAGAKGYAIKNFSDGLLWKCVLTLAKGGEAFQHPQTRWLPEELNDAQRLARLARSKPSEVGLLTAFARMTQRPGFRTHGAIKQLRTEVEASQSELLRGLKDGAAERLARDILEQLRKRLGFHSSVEAAQWYARTLPPPAAGQRPHPQSGRSLARP